MALAKVDYLDWQWIDNELDWQWIDCQLVTVSPFLLQFCCCVIIATHLGASSGLFHGCFFPLYLLPHLLLEEWKSVLNRMNKQGQSVISACRNGFRFWERKALNQSPEQTQRTSYQRLLLSHCHDCDSAEKKPQNLGMQGNAFLLFPGDSGGQSQGHSRAVLLSSSPLTFLLWKTHAAWVRDTAADPARSPLAPPEAQESWEDPHSPSPELPQGQRSSAPPLLLACVKRVHGVPRYQRGVCVCSRIRAPC